MESLENLKESNTILSETVNTQNEDKKTHKQIIILNH